MVKDPPGGQGLQAAKESIGDVDNHGKNTFEKMLVLNVN